MQQVRFGMALDGERGWHARNALGDTTVGPFGMLSLLEMQLGLSRRTTSACERIVQFRDCLRRSATGHRFYEDSFKLDSLGTASTLLAWRDLWYEHGWRGVAPAGGCRRISDMVAVEAFAREAVFPGTGQRLQDVAMVLRHRKPQISAVELVQPLEQYPESWREVLALLPIKRRQNAVGASAPEGTLLHRLQEQLLSSTAGGRAEKVPWAEDGTVILVRADSGLAAAEWLANEIREHPTTDRLIVTSHEGGLLDAALFALDRARHGLSEPAAARPSLQVLPLALRLLWAPLDFGALMQFLTHPIGPVRRYARGRLAEKMAQAPGIGGMAWQRVLDDIAEHYKDQGPQVREQIALWLEQPRFQPAEQAPLDVVLERVGQMEDYFRLGQIGDNEVRRAAFQTGLTQCQVVRHAIELLRKQGETAIGPEALDRVVSQATAGTVHPFAYAEAGAGARVQSPAAVIEPFAEICWWTMKAVPFVAPYPWSASERAALKAMGVELPSTEDLLARQAQGWLRPVMSATERMILVLPRPDEEAHPLWLSLAALVDRPVVQEVEEILRHPPQAGVLARIPLRPLPAPRRWWHIPAGAIHGWDRAASYSSLEILFYSPWRWSLQYPANFRGSALLELPGDFQLCGNLAHRVVERLYREPGALGWSSERVVAWFDSAFEGLLLEEGALLFTPGRGADRVALRLGLRRSVAELHRLLQAAGAAQVQPECPLHADTPLGRIEGSCDLLVTLTDGRKLVLDMKWSGNRKYREKLETQTHIQLAIYARLIENNSSRWPMVAYFILRQPQILTTDDVFPGVASIRVPGGSTALVWERISAMWRWRRVQIEQGELEVALEHVEPTAESVPPTEALRPDYLDEQYNPFRHLAGWAETL